MQKLFQNIFNDRIDVVGADTQIYNIPIHWKNEFEFAERTREDILSTGVFLWLGIPVHTHYGSTIDNFIEDLEFEAHHAKPFDKGVANER